MEFKSEYKRNTHIMVFEIRGNTHYNIMYDDMILDVVNNVKYSKWQCFQTQKSIAQRSLVALHNLFIVFNQTD